jgi:hypothetical protein
MARKLDLHRLIDLSNRLARTAAGTSAPLNRFEKVSIPARHFKTHVARLTEMTILPWRLMHDYVIAGHLYGEAARRATGGREWRISELTGPQIALAAKRYDELIKQVSEHKSAKRRVERGLGISKAKETFNRLMGEASPRNRFAIDAIISSVIVSGWTAFEALCEDLWVHIVNRCPRLGLIALDAEIKDGEKRQKGESEPEVYMPMPVHRLLDPDYKIQEHMGDLLHEYKRDFSRRGDAEKSYKKIFPELRREIEAIFGDRKLRWAAATRNVIVHSGGFADGGFIRAVRDYPSFRSSTPGQSFLITGRNAYDLCMASINSGLAILDLAENWMKNNRV